jgi:hypothetical protein
MIKDNFAKKAMIPIDEVLNELSLEKSKEKMKNILVNNNEVKLMSDDKLSE